KKSVTRMLLQLLLLAEIRQPGTAAAVEGANLNLTCSHPAIKGTENIFWYQQFPGWRLQFIVTGFKESTQSCDPEGVLYIPEDRQSSTLALLSVSDLSDSATYYCAASDTVT
uniref:Ig-like domain-containing protein n=1 Tax=Pelusios castaneus TaxID=367368 RepID=A0A8C8SNN3_9SAUR